MGKQDEKTPMTLKRAAELCAQEFTIVFPGGSEEKIYVRTQTYPEYMEVQNILVQKHKELKDKYQKGTPFYDFIMSDLDDRDNIVLASLVVRGEQEKIAVKVRQEAKSLMPFDPSKYTDADERQKAEEEYEKRQDEHEAEITDALSKAYDARQEELAAKPHEELVEMATKPAVTGRIIEECNQLAQDYQIYQCIRQYADHKLPYFDSIDEVSAQPITIKVYLLATIGELGNVEPLDIKNSQGRSVLRIGPAEDTQELTKDSSTQTSQESDSPKKSSRGGRRKSSTD